MTKQSKKAGTFFNIFADTFDSLYENKRNPAMRILDGLFRSDIEGRFQETFKEFGDLSSKSVFDIVDKVRSGKLNVLTQDPSVALLREELHLMLSRIVYALVGIGLLVLSLVIYLWIRWDEDLTFSFHLTIALFAGLGGGMILSSIFNRRKK